MSGFPNNLNSDAVPELLTSEDLQTLFDVSERQLRRWIASGFLPRPVKHSRGNRWRPDDIAQFIRELPFPN